MHPNYLIRNGTYHDLKSVLDVKSSDVRGVFAIKVSACVPERFFFARSFCPPQVVKGGGSAERICWRCRILAVHSA
jgi:hypothetical protein